MTYENNEAPRRDLFNRSGRRPTQQRNTYKPKRAPLPEGFSLFYIAIVCPENIELEVKNFKNHMFENYGSKAASKSPAHITIVPPFKAEDDLTPHLLDFISTFNIGIVPFQINLSGYGNFGDRVLFVDVAPNEKLQQLELECMNEFVQQFPSIIFGANPPFNPHVTIATRDIPEGKLEEAKAYFESNHPFERSFETKQLQLLKLENGNWNIV